MQNEMMTITSKLPTVNKVYAPLDIVGKTVGRYFDYKRETTMIEHETIKVKKQTKIILAEIESRLTVSLDENKKNFQQEMYRLKTIAKELKNDSKNRDYYYRHIEELTKMLSNPDIPLSMKETIPSLMAMTHQAIGEENGLAMQKLNLMSSFKSNQILVEGE